MNLHFIHTATLPEQSKSAEGPVILRVSGILFLLSFIFVYMGTQAQTISLNKKRMTAIKVIEAIQAQSGYNLLYASGLLEEGKKTNVSFEKASLTDALDVAVSKQPYTYELIGKTIVLKRRVVNMPSKDVEGKEEAMINTGYQKIKKKQSTGSYGEVSKEEIERNSSSTMLDHLSKVSGITVQGNSIKIRGTNSIQSGTDPLILLDGMPYLPNNINMIDPHMVQNITVLKDADATAIYGSRGGNGVILITTIQAAKTGQNNNAEDNMIVNTDGSIQFRKTSVAVLMKEIGLWYELQVSYEGESPEDNYSGNLAKSTPIEEMLRILQSTGIKLKQEGKNIVISRQN